MLSWLRVANNVRSHRSALSSLSRTVATRKTRLPSPSLTTPGTRYASSKSKPKQQKQVKDTNTNNKAPAKEPKDKLISSSTLIPGSQQPIVDESTRAEYAKAEATMRTAVDWFRKECAAAESRASGRVTPALLEPVRVKLAGAAGAVGLDQIATVGVREGTTLIVSVFDETSIKQVEQAIYEAKIPHVVPQKHDARTIKIPIPKPTVEARIAEYTAQQRKAEDIRAQIRKALQASLKRGKYDKRSVELAEFQKLSDRHINEVDQTLVILKKATGAK